MAYGSKRGRGRKIEVEMIEIDRNRDRKIEVYREKKEVEDVVKLQFVRYSISEMSSSWPSRSKEKCLKGMKNLVSTLTQDKP